MTDARVVIVVENQAVPRDRRVWREALALRDAGYDVHVISPALGDYRVAHEVLDGITIHRHRLSLEANTKSGFVREYAEALLRELWLALRIWRSGRFDVLQLCNPPDMLFLVALWFKYVYGVAVIFDHHDLVPELFEAKFGARPWARRLMIAVERLDFAVSDVVVCVNESHRGIALTRGHKRPEDVFVVRNGPDLSELPRESRTGGAPDGSPHKVGYLGEVGTQDGLEGLVDVAVDIVYTRGRSDVNFVVIGDGPNLPAIRRLSADAGLADHMSFTGYLTGDAMWEELSTCDVCVAPDPKNAYNDASTMMKVMEYMALGLPIVQYDLREGRCSAGDAALYATDVTDFADRVIALIDDPIMREAVGRVGRRRLEEKLHWGVQVPALLQAYRRALLKRRKRGRN